MKARLELKRETLAPLTQEQLERVAGGFTDIRVSFSCCLWGSCATQPRPK